MEFLFTVEWASTEAILVLICVGIFVAFFAYDGYIFLRRFFHVLTPKKETPSENNATEVLPIQQEENLELIENSSFNNQEDSSPSELVQEQGEKGLNNTDISMEIHDEIAEEKQTTINETISPVIPEEHPQYPGETSSQEQIRQDVEENKGVLLGEGENTNLTGDGSLEDATLEPEKIPEIVPEEESSENTVVEAPPEEKETVEETIAEPKQEEITESIEPIPNVKNEVASDIAEETEKEYNNPIKEPVVQDVIPEPIPVREELPQPVGQVIETKNNHAETIFGLINNIRTLIARGQTLEARGLIIQGLALEKDNKDLNMFLASLYEQDRHFEKAEYIYKDLALLYPNDIEILEKLGNVLIIERRYEIALEMYKKILSLSGETEGTLYILAHLSNELGQHEVTYMYGKKYQKQWPNNPEILTLISTAEIALGKRQDAIQTLIKLKNLTPYNHEISEMIQKLVMEEELANNFNSTNLK